VVVIEPAGPREIAWMNTAAYGLSPREREIVDLVARGLNEGDLHGALHLPVHSPGASLEHLRQGRVRGRRALVKVPFLDASYP
jgi:DNA-binding CsgD family transcriptional regulator